MKTKLLAGLIMVIAPLSVGVALGCDSCMGSCADGQCEATEIMQPDEQVGVSTEAPIIGTDALAALLRAKIPVTVLDARSGKFDDGQRVPGAKSLNAAYSDEKIAGVLPDKASLVITYCAGLSCPASHQLAQRLVKMGYVSVIEYPEGIAGWLKAGNKVETVVVAK